jgi:hypothetical protein
MKGSRPIACCTGAQGSNKASPVSCNTSVGITVCLRVARDEKRHADFAAALTINAQISDLRGQINTYVTKGDLALSTQK